MTGSSAPSTTALRRTAADRPPLRLVELQEKASPSRRARWRPAVLLVATVTCTVLFGVVASHVVLNQGQAELDTLQARVAVEQLRSQRLRLEVANLQSPLRVVGEARDRLGMVPPAGVAYLTSGNSGPRVAPPPTVPLPAPAAESPAAAPAARPIPAVTFFPGAPAATSAPGADPVAAPAARSTPARTPPTAAPSTPPVTSPPRP